MRTTRSLPDSAATILSRQPLIFARVCSALITGLALSLPVAATPFTTINLVTDDQTVNAAQITDPNLVNAWGISHSPTSPFWVSSNGKALSTLYRVDPLTNATTKVGLEVAIPGAGNVTGQVFNIGSTSGNFNGDAFLFVSEDGTISGWKGSLGTTAEVLQLGSPANSYKGTAISLIGNDAYLYSANFETAKIDVLKGNAAAPDLSGSFTDPGIPDGFAPFNIQNLGDTLYVTYAKVGPTGDDEAGPGNGFVSAFGLQGNFLGRVGTMGTLNSPWGLALAPASFREFAGDLLVGNFGDGRINVFDIGTDSFVAQLQNPQGTPLEIDGLWGLIHGNDGSGGSAQASIALVALGITLLGGTRRRSRC